MNLHVFKYFKYLGMGLVSGTIAKGHFVQGMQHPRIFGRGHIGRGRTNIAPFTMGGPRLDPATSSRRSHIYCHQAFPRKHPAPSSSPRGAPSQTFLSGLLTPRSVGGEACDGCNLNSKPRLLLNWWSRTV